MSNKFTKQTWPMMNQIFDWVQEELKKRKMNTKEYDGVNGMSEIRTPFVRLTSGLTRHNVYGKLVNNDRFLTLGLHGYKEQGNIFTLTYGAEDIVGYSYEKRGDASTTSPQQHKVSSTSSLIKKNSQSQSSVVNIVDGTHPVPGITKITVNRLAINPSKATVDWVCYNLSQLEYLRHYFLTPGIICVLDYGHYHGKNNILSTSNMLNFHDQNIDSEIAEYMVQGKSKLYEKYISKSNGNYDVFIGIVTNFSFTFDGVNQRYNCTTQLMSASEIFYGISTDHTSYFSTGQATVQQTTLHDYFNSENGGFLRRVMTDCKSDTKIIDEAAIDNFKLKDHEEQMWPDHTLIKEAPYHTTYKENIALSTIKEMNNDKSAEQSPSVVFNTEDNYITLLYFINVILPDFAKMIESSDSSAMSSYIDKLKFNYWNEPLVGYSRGLIEFHDKTVNDTRGLLSTDPAVCIIVDQLFPNLTFLRSVFRNGSHVTVVGTSSENQPMFAQLSAGIWLNTKMIMRIMMDSQRLDESLQSILNSISTATANFWKLRLIYNEHLDIFQIIDEGNRKSKENLEKLRMSAYKFNQDVNGELVNLEFTTTLSNEQASQIIFSTFDNREMNKTNPKLFDHFSKTQRMSVLDGSLLVDKYTSEITIGRDLFSKATSKLQSAEQASIAHISNVIKLDPNIITTFYDVKSNVIDDKNFYPSTMMGKITKGSGQGVANTIILPLTARDNAETQQYYDANSDNVHYMEKSLNTLDQNFREKLDRVINKMENEGYGIEILETYRSQKRQEFLFNSNTGVTKTKTGYHPFGLAADVKIYKMQGKTKYTFEPNSVLHKDAYPYETLRNFASEEKLRTLWPVSGSTFFDPGHIELRKALPDANKYANDVQQTKQKEMIAVNAKQVDAQKLISKIESKFGNSILAYIDISKDSMMNRIITYTNRSQDALENSFNSIGFPAITPNEISIETIGISGIIGSDVFLVDKIPETFNNHGMFQTFEVTQTIDPQSGWRTKLRARWVMTKPFDKE